MRILLIDNNDSFTYNIAQLVIQTGYEKLDIISYSKLGLAKIKQYDKIIISPGPGLPSDFPKYQDWILACAPDKSILGICMGHEIIASIYGAELEKLEKVRHGIKEQIQVIDRSDHLFQNIPSPFDAGLYHSWVVSNKHLPQSLRITSEDSSGSIMSISHEMHDIQSVQFHPESFMTSCGTIMFKNWLNYM